MSVIDFYPELVDPYTLVFVDTTKRDSETLPPDINTLAFRLHSPYLEPSTLEADALVYIYTYRKHREWFTLTADQMGVEEGAKIPDGVYTASFVVNNSEIVEHSFIVYQAYESAVKLLLDEAGFKVDADETNLLYQNSDKYDFETYSILYSLLGAIIQNMLDGNLAAAELALVKGHRILKTIETTGYNII